MKTRSQVVYLDEKPVGETDKLRMKDKHKFKLFDGSGASIKKTMPNANVAKFEERYEPPQFDDECKVA